MEICGTLLDWLIYFMNVWFICELFGTTVQLEKSH